MLKIEYVDYEIPVYDITVEENHNFFANGILVHNCSEIMLSTSPKLNKETNEFEEYTAVCCLASVNLEKYDEWKDDFLFIEDVMRLLDNVITDFITKAKSGKFGDPKAFAPSIRSAEYERSVGLGVMGLHTYLQSKMIPFESSIAEGFQRKVFSFLKEATDRASIQIAKEKGPCPMSKEFGDGSERFVCKMAVAPTGSISILCGNVSPGIDPIIANCYIHENKTGKHSIRNPHLEVFINNYAAENGKDKKWVEKQWKEISKERGSVQHLDWLPSNVKEVFKTAYELDQRWIISHAAARQEFIDQGQSVNLFFNFDVEKSYLAYVHLMAWKKGLKSLYYCRSQSATKAVSNHEREIIQEMDKYQECLSCQ